MVNPISHYQEKVLEKLAGRVDDFYLAGGTALAKFYFQHRESYDLDFFTKKYSSARIDAVAKFLYRDLAKEMKLVRDQKTRKMARMRMYEIELDKGHVLKVDFVEDVFDLLKPLKKVDGVFIL